MPELPNSFRDLLLMLAGGPKKRTKLSEELGRTYWQTTHWARQDSIPAEYWDDIIDLAARRGIPGVTHEYLKRLKRRKDSQIAIENAEKETHGRF